MTFAFGNSRLMTGRRKMFNGFLSIRRWPGPRSILSRRLGPIGAADALELRLGERRELVGIANLLREHVIQGVLQERLLVDRLELRMRVQDELEQRGPGARKAHDEDRTLRRGGLGGILPARDVPRLTGVIGDRQRRPRISREALRA